MRWQRHSSDADARIASSKSSVNSPEDQPMPVLQGQRPGMVVLAGVDGTRSGQAALRVAAARAAALDAELVGVHVPPVLPWLWSPELIALTPQLRADVEADAFFDTAEAAEQAGVQWSFVVAPGGVASVLRQQAVEVRAAMVVVGARARQLGFHRCPARRLAASCPRPVIVVGDDRCDVVRRA
jgi:nucleotide-binding universal stress UspA family protein